MHISRIAALAATLALGLAACAGPAEPGDTTVLETGSAERLAYLLEPDESQEKQPAAKLNSGRDCEIIGPDGGTARSGDCLTLADRARIYLDGREPVKVDRYGRVIENE